MIPKLNSILFAATLAAATTAHAHQHLAAGANSTTPGSPLIFVNAANFESSSGFVFNLEPGDTGSPYDGYFITGDLTFEALAATPPFGGPEAQAAALGSHIEAVLETLEGPAGASFAFWETPAKGGAGTNQTWSVQTGLTNGTNHIVISETDGSTGADPYGHIHGRVYSVDKPGFYRVGFRFVDTSNNGPAGGPIQAPSERFYLNFQADHTIASIATNANGLAISFAAPSDVPDEDPSAPPATYQLEATTALGPTAHWQPIGDPVSGDDHLHTVNVPLTGTAGFYRLRSE